MREKIVTIELEHWCYGIRAYRMGSVDVVVLVAAVQALGVVPEMQPRLPIGIGAFSFAVGPALIAALDSRVAERADFVVAVGGYRSTTADHLLHHRRPSRRQGHAHTLRQGQVNLRSRRQREAP